MIEGNRWQFRFSSLAPARRSRAGSGPPPQYRLGVDTTDEAILKPVGAVEHDLRQYTSQPVEYEAQLVSEIGARSADLTISTLPVSQPWPTGPNLRFRHKVRRSYVRRAMGIVSGVLGVMMLSLVAGGLFDTEPLNKGILLAVGALLLVMAGWLLLRKWEFKK